MPFGPRTYSYLLGLIGIILIAPSVYSQGSRSLADTTDLREQVKRNFSLVAEQRALDYFANGLYAEDGRDYYHAARSYKAALDFFPESHELAYSLANAYVNLREPEQAIKVADKVQPPNEEILTVKASAYRMLGDVDEYRGVYLQMTQIDPANDRALAILVELYLRQGDLDSAGWALESLTHYRAAEWPVWNQLGRVRLSQGRYDDALAAFNKSLELDDSVDNLNGWVGKADVFEATAQSDSLSAALERTVDLTGANPMVLSRLASVLSDQEKFAEASGYVRELVQQVPNDLDQLRRLGMLFFYADSLSQAETIFDSLIAQNDENYLNHYFLALIYDDRHEPAMAKDQFAIVAELAGSESEPWLNLGLAYRNLGEVDSAKVTYETGLKRVITAADSVRLIFATGAIQEEMGQVDQSIASFEWVLAIDPGFHPAMNYLGYMLADRNVRLDYALELISKAVEMQPNNTAYLDSYGWVYYRLGDYEKAITYLKRAAELDSDPVMFDHLGDAFSATGDGGQARLWWKKALDLDPENEAIKEKLSD